MNARLHWALISTFSVVSAFAVALPAAANNHNHPGGMSGIIATIRQATAQYKNVSVAEAHGYASAGNCVSGGDGGAMGVHYIKGSLVGDGVIDVHHPEILVYAPGADGKMRLAAAEFVTLASAWDAAHPGAPPVLMGQLFDYHSSPNRYGLPAFYALHVWAWDHNPNGAFADWNPNVSCISYTGA